MIEFRFDPVADAALIVLGARDDGEAEDVSLTDLELSGEVLARVHSSGRLLGFEVLRASQVLPLDLLEWAVKSSGGSGG